jgi:hypothetical protein
VGRSRLKSVSCRRVRTGEMTIVYVSILVGTNGCPVADVSRCPA